MAGWITLFVILGLAFGFAQALTVFLPFGLLVLLGLFAVWQISRPKARECPVCGMPVDRGLTKCGHCGHDFAAAATSVRHSPQQ